MSLSLESTYLSGYTQDTSQVSADQLTAQIQGAETDEETMEACQEFETYLLQQLFESMEKTADIFSDEDEEEDNDYVEMFSDNCYEAIASQMVESGQGLGIAQQLCESMKRNA